MRKLSTLALEVVASGGAGAAPAPASAAAGDELDLSTGSRDFLTKESAEELLAPMLASGSQVRRVRFSTKSFGVDAAHVAARAIENVAATLEDADMSDIIAGRPGGALRQAPHGADPWLGHCFHSRGAVLSPRWLLHTAVGHPPPTRLPALPWWPAAAEDEALAALRIISAALGRARLRHLNLSDNALGEKGIRACADAFSEQVRSA